MLLEETESCPEDPKETGARLWAQRKAQPSRPLMATWALFDFTAEVAVRRCLSSQSFKTFTNHVFMSSEEENVGKRVE